MKVGIITYHRADNFGAVLQSFALMQYLHQEGHDVEIIDYRCKYLEARYDIYNPRILFFRKNFLISLKEYLGRFANIGDRRERHAKFELFRKQHLVMSRPLTLVQFPLEYDVIVTGSDQVWNFHLNKGSESVYLLDFTCRPDTLRVAYAASSDCNGLNRIDRDVITKALDRFDRISVREDFLRKELAALTSKKIEMCLDPTFFLTQNMIEKMIIKVRPEKYILVFHMTPLEDFIPFIQKIARENQAEVVEVYGGFQVCSNKNQLCNWGPQELLSLIAHAEKIFTTSFHGLSLSLIMQKEVWVINKGDNLRQQNLLSLAGLQCRLLNTPEDYNEDAIDYDKVSGNIMPVLEQSKSFLNL